MPCWALNVAALGQPYPRLAVVVSIACCGWLANSCRLVPLTKALAGTGAFNSCMTCTPRAHRAAAAKAALPQKVLAPTACYF